MLLQKIASSLKFPASRAKGGWEGGEGARGRRTGAQRAGGWEGAAREARRELQKCEALELKLCLPGPTESR